MACEGAQPGLRSLRERLLAAMPFFSSFLLSSSALPLFASFLSFCSAGVGSAAKLNGAAMLRVEERCEYDHVCETSYERASLTIKRTGVTLTPWLIVSARRAGVPSERQKA